tara:strand:+ start:17449 stop:18603 length:1155 start_codon:yes stop_codon:yes gene_type:complete
VTISNKNNIEDILSRWKFEIIFDNFKLDIKENIKEFINKKNILKIKKNNDLISKYKKKTFNYKKNPYLKISYFSRNKWHSFNIKNNVPLIIDLNLKLILKTNINIVYFINSDISSCYIKLMKDQLNDFIKSRIFNNKQLKLYIMVICSDKRREKIIRKFIIEKIKNYNIKYEISFRRDNHKEYEGINKVWEIARNNKSNDLIIYLHAKGISYMQNKFLYIRQPIEKLIFKLIIKNWENNIELLTRIKSIYKIGVLSGGNGWLWFNFWIAKSTYISKIEKPKKRNRACYYEDWIGRCLINSENINLKKYTNEYNETYLNTIENTFSILNDPSKDKYNIGTPCKVEKGGFVGLGITKYTYRIWYYFFYLMNKLSINKAKKNRFILF